MPALIPITVAALAITPLITILSGIVRIRPHLVMAVVFALRPAIALRSAIAFAISVMVSIARIGQGQAW
jgi:hypothetical protein